MKVSAPNETTEQTTWRRCALVTTGDWQRERVDQMKANTAYLFELLRKQRSNRRVGTTVEMCLEGAVLSVSIRLEHSRFD